MRGKYIVFEGCDGTGKGMQLNLLKDYLTEKGIKFLETREPGGTDLGDAQRDILKQPLESYKALDQTFGRNKERNLHRHPISELLMFLVQRNELFEKVIKPELEKGTWIITDRSYLSSIAYQCYARITDENERKRVLEFAKFNHDFIIGDYYPDLIFIFDINLGEMGRRINLDGNRSKTDFFDSESMEFHSRVKQGYLDEAKKNPERIFVINAERSPEEIFWDVKKKLEKIL